MSEGLNGALNLMRRMPPKHVQNHVYGLMGLMPAEAEELLQRIDQPLREAVDPENGRKFLISDYNRDGDSYRSPWTNAYNPPIPEGDGFVPSQTLREIEITANEIFESYREMYYQGGSSSVYMWDLEKGFAACFLVKKDVAEQRFVKSGSWNSIHVLEVSPLEKNEYHYKLTTTVLLSMDVQREELGESNLSGHLTRQTDKKRTFEDENVEGVGPFHIAAMGSMIEDMEIEMRSNMDMLYISKTREVLNGMRKLSNVVTPSSIFVGELAGAVQQRVDK